MKEEKENIESILEYFSSRTTFWKNVYSGEFEEYDFFHHASVMKRKMHVLDLVDKYSSGRSLDILDSGCGAGVIMEELLRRGHRVSGLDISPGMVQEAKNTLKEYDSGKCSIQLGNVEKIDFPESSFDICLCIGVLQYLDQDERAMKELTRVTRPNGYIILSLPNIAKTTAILDPYHVFFRGIPYIFHKLFHVRKNVRGSASEDISKNKTFRNRRYFHRQIAKLGNRFGARVCDVRPIGYGPVTLFRKELFSRPTSLRIAGWFENMAAKRGLSVLKRFADRWVIGYRKSTFPI